MTSAKHREESPTVAQETAEDMVKYGITRVPTDYFYYKGYRYTNLEDAIAQAKRLHPRSHRMDANNSGQIPRADKKRKMLQ